MNSKLRIPLCWKDHLQKFSVFAHYENVDRPEGIDGTLIRMVRGLDRWVWMIPLTPTRMSVGVVMDTSAFRALRLSPEAVLERCIAEQPLIAERMTRAERVTPVYSAGDYSYRLTQLFGERWMLAGDAAGFIDPVFSSGVFLPSCRRRQRRIHSTRFSPTARASRACSNATRAGSVRL